MKDFFETIASIPFFRIAINIFSGGFGWRTPLAFVLQVVLQVFCASLLGLPVAGVVGVALLLCVLHLCTGLLIALQPLSGMGPGKPTYNTDWGYVKLALMISSIIGGIGAAVIIGSATFLAGSGLAAFGHAFALSTIGGTIVHVFGVVLPILRVSKQ